MTKYDLLWSKMTLSGMISKTTSKSPGKSNEVQTGPHFDEHYLKLFNQFRSPTLDTLIFDFSIVGPPMKSSFG
jgi:hypothetical protein